MINTPIFYMFSPEEFSLFCKQYIAIIEKIEPEKLGISTPLYKIKEAASNIEDCCKNSFSKSFIKDVIKTNISRDDALKAIKYYLESCSNRLKDNWKISSKLIQEEFIKIKTQDKGSDFIKESRAINTFIKKLQTDSQLKDAVRIIKMEDLLVELQETEEAFEIALQTRNQIITDHTEYGIEYIFRVLRDSVEQINNYICIMQQIQPNAMLENTIKIINEIILGFNNIVLSKKARTANQLY